MIRNLSHLADRSFDLLVVGGGIYGLTIACDAARRGLSVALIEREDFGSGSTFNHLRTIHGGLRYLQTLDLTRARESLEERRTIARIAPQAVRPLPFVLPVYPSWTSGPMALRTAFLIDRLISHDRNRGVDPTRHLPRGLLLRRAEALERFPMLPAGAVAAAVWHDYVTIEADRLTFAWARAATTHGAVIANHVEAIGLCTTGTQVGGVEAVDRRSGDRFQVAAALTINATGSSVGRLLSSVAVTGQLPLVKAMNLVTARSGETFALAGRAPEGRNFFMVPWRGRALFGTWESGVACQPGDTSVSAEEVDDFVTDLNRAFPELALDSGEVTLAHRGLVPASKQRDGSLRLRGQEFVRNHAVDGVQGLISVAGTKYTTARVVAHAVVDLASKLLNRRTDRCRTADTPLPGMQLQAPASLTAALNPAGPIVDASSLQHLAEAYGETAADVLRLAQDRPALQRRLSPHSPVLAVQLIWAVRHEMALTLTDAVVRRTPLGALGYPGDQVAAESAALIGAELGWTDATVRDEISALQTFYAIRSSRP